jgi:hypothetical protein
MRAIFVGAGALTLFALWAAPATAQTTGRSSNISVSRGSLAIAPYGGYLLSQRFFDGPVSTALNVSSAPLYGAQVTLPLAPSASLTGSIAHANGDLEAGLPIIGGVSFGTAATTIFDAGVELRIGSERGRTIPIIQLGGGAIQRKVTVAGVSASTTDFQVSGGLGVDVPVTSNLALRIMAKDYYGKADFGSLGPLNARTEDLHAIALTGGIRISF